MFLIIIIRSGLLFPGHQARNTRVKKRGVISSTWLEKYKPELPDDSHHSNVCSDNLVGNEPESDSFDINEHNFAENGLNDGNNTMSTAGSCESSCLSIEEPGYGMESCQNSSITVERNETMKSPEVNAVINIQDGNEETSVTRKDVMPLKSKRREQNKNHEYLNDNLLPKVTDTCQALKMRCTGVSDSVTITKSTIISNELIGGTDAMDCPQEIVSNKRKAEGRSTELEKPSKKFRTDGENEEELMCDVSQV